MGQWLGSSGGTPFFRQQQSLPGKPAGSPMDGIVERANGKIKNLIKKNMDRTVLNPINGDLAFWHYLLGAAGDNGMDVHWSDADITGTASLKGVCSVEGFIEYRAAPPLSPENRTICSVMPPSHRPTLLLLPTGRWLPRGEPGPAWLRGRQCPRPPPRTRAWRAGQPPPPRWQAHRPRLARS